MTEPTGMAAFISALTTGVTADTLWANIVPAAGFIVAMILFAVGYRIVKKSVNGASKLKAKM